MNAATLLQKVLPPFEVRATCQDIESFLRADNGLCVDIVKAQALSLAKVADKTLHTIKIDGMKPGQLALLLIYNVLTTELQSGRRHIYRGMLSMVGHDMLRLWHLTAKESVARGYWTQQDYEADIKGLRHDIQAVG